MKRRRIKQGRNTYFRAHGKNAKILHKEEDDGSDSSDETLIPLLDISWIRKLLMCYEEYVNMMDVDILLTCNGSPRSVLRSNDFKYLKEKINMFSLKTCPYSSSDNIYAAMMRSAAYIRRIELRGALSREKERDE